MEETRMIETPWCCSEEGPVEYYLNAFKDATDESAETFYAMLETTLESITHFQEELQPEQRDGLAVFFIRTLGSMYEVILADKVMPDNDTDASKDLFMASVKKTAEIVAVLDPEFCGLPIAPQEPSSVIDVTLFSLTSAGLDFMQSLGDDERSHIEDVYKNMVDLTDEERNYFIETVTFLYAVADFCFVEPDADMTEELKLFFERENDRLEIFEDILEAYSE
jgi:hypothetical protein